MIPNAAPAAAAAHGLMAAWAADWIRAGNLHGPGRVAAALGAVVVAWGAGRLGSAVLAGVFRLALLAAGCLFAYQILRVG